MFAAQPAGSSLASEVEQRFSKPPDGETFGPFRAKHPPASQNCGAATFLSPNAVQVVNPARGHRVGERANDTCGLVPPPTPKSRENACTFAAPSLVFPLPRRVHQQRSLSAPRFAAASDCFPAAVPTGSHRPGPPPAALRLRSSIASNELFAGSAAARPGGTRVVQPASRGGLPRAIPRRRPLTSLHPSVLRRANSAPDPAAEAISRSGSCGGNRALSSRETAVGPSGGPGVNAKWPAQQPRPSDALRRRPVRLDKARARSAPSWPRLDACVPAQVEQLASLLRRGRVRCPARLPRRRRPPLARCTWASNRRPPQQAVIPSVPSTSIAPPSVRGDASSPEILPTRSPSRPVGPPKTTRLTFRRTHAAPCRNKVLGPSLRPRAQPTPQQRRARPPHSPTERAGMRRSPLGHPSQRSAPWCRLPTASPMGLEGPDRFAAVKDTAAPPVRGLPCQRDPKQRHLQAQPEANHSFGPCFGPTSVQTYVLRPRYTRGS